MTFKAGSIVKRISAYIIMLFVSLALLMAVTCTGINRIIAGICMTIGTNIPCPQVLP